MLVNPDSANKSIFKVCMILGLMLKYFLTIQTYCDVLHKKTTIESLCEAFFSHFCAYEIY
tara:strand:+ start:4779 stop:4958 length:180 start_codon:yes stop_codon:yes gene_type:complete